MVGTERRRSELWYAFLASLARGPSLESYTLFFIYTFHWLIGIPIGVVTRFDIETIDNNRIWFEGLLVDADQQDKLIEAAVSYAAAAEDDVDASATYNLGPTGGAVYLAYNKPVARPEIFQRFYDIPHQTVINSTVGTSAEYHDAVSALNPFSTLR